MLLFRYIYKIKISTEKKKFRVRSSCFCRLEIPHKQRKILKEVQRRGLEGSQRRNAAGFSSYSTRMISCPALHQEPPWPDESFSIHSPRKLLMTAERRLLWCLRAQGLTIICQFYLISDAPSAALNTLCCQHTLCVCKDTWLCQKVSLRDTQRVTTQGHVRATCPPSTEPHKLSCSEGKMMIPPAEEAPYCLLLTQCILHTLTPAAQHRLRSGGSGLGCNQRAAAHL